MPRAPIERKPVARTVVPFPNDWRDTFLRLSVCFDVTFSRGAFDELAEICGANTDDFYFTGASKADPEVGLVAHTVGKAAERKLHISFEFQSKRVSPYPKVPQRTLTDIVRRIEKGDELELRHAEFSFGAASTDEHPLRLPEAIPQDDGSQIVVTGLNFEVIPPPGSNIEKGSKLRRQRGAKVATLTNWLRLAHRVQTLEEGFRLAKEQALSQSLGS